MQVHLSSFECNAADLRRFEIVCVSGICSHSPIVIVIDMFLILLIFTNSIILQFYGSPSPVDTVFDFTLIFRHRKIQIDTDSNRM